MVASMNEAKRMLSATEIQRQVNMILIVVMILNKPDTLGVLLRLDGYHS